MALFWFDLASLAVAAATWRFLWRHGATPRERIIYDAGVRRFGVRMAVIGALVSIWSTRGEFAGHSVWQVIAFDLGFLPGFLTIGLWTGFGWGQAMAWIFARRQA